MTSSAAATWGPTPGAANKAGAACAHSRAISASSSLISALRARQRAARTRSDLLAAAAASPRPGSGRSRAQASTSAAVRRPRSGAATCSGAVTSSPLSWLTAAVRALTAERRAARSIRIASTAPSADFAPRCGLARQHRTRGCLGIGGIALVPSASPPLGAKHLDHRHIVCGEMTRQARAVAAGAFHADALHAAQAAQPSPQLLIAGSRRRQRRCAQQPSRRIHRCCGVRVAVGVHPADNGSILIRHNRSALPGTLPMDRAPPAGTTHSALKALEPTLLSGHIPSDRLVRAPDRPQADRSFARHQASEDSSQARTRRERTSIMSAKSQLFVRGLSVIQRRRQYPGQPDPVVSTEALTITK